MDVDLSAVLDCDPRTVKPLRDLTLSEGKNNDVSQFPFYTPGNAV